MTNHEPVDRRERVREMRNGDGVVRQRIVEDAAAAREQTLNRIGQFVWLIFGALISLIALRVVLKAVGANPANTFAQLIYEFTEIFLQPFFGLLGTPAAGEAGQFQLELSSLVAIVVYALIAYVIVRLIKIIFGKSSVRRISTIERD
jgi:uncharacterized protein YggT (Ycf19 family)